MDYIQQSSSTKKHQQHQSSSDHRKSTKVKIKKSSMASAIFCRRVSFTMALMFILIELLLLINLSQGAKSFYLHWNTTNPIAPKVHEAFKSWLKMSHKGKTSFTP
ncbi:hypothetical protein PVAND_017574 [Polypedilum vanderplanki]|uniref:Uncharacterized protein n=1 Tax=Polypedilum vanderplanki TaxID=319348 RepID=A0A9J6BJF7_POLVA|nr:hypothetical protein PVAND_017574 [Polypedilum vanderplanki]